MLELELRSESQLELASESQWALEWESQLEWELALVLPSVLVWA